MKSMKVLFSSFIRILFLPFTIFGALLSCAGCASTAPQALHEKVAQVSNTYPAQSSAEQETGISVRWGGRIIETLPESGRTCFQIIARPLSRDGRPATERNGYKPHLGRFLACHVGFYDPEIYQPGRDMTVLGKISDHQTIKIGEYDYVLPQVEAYFIYLWPLQAEMPPPPAYSPYYYPYGPWGPWYPAARYGGW